MKKLVLFIFFVIMVFAGYSQEFVEGDSLVIYGGGTFENEVQGVEATNPSSFITLSQLIAITGADSLYFDISNGDLKYYGNDSLLGTVNMDGRYALIDSSSLVVTTLNNSGEATFTNDTLNIPNYGKYTNNNVQTLSGTSIDFDIELGRTATLTLTGGTVLNILNLPNGVEGTIEVTNGSTAYTLNINGSTGYTAEVVKGTKSAINSAISSRTTVIFWRTGSTLFYGFLYDN